MSRDPLRFYPRAWRERYGDELAALVEDDLVGRPMTRRMRAGLAVSGVRERARLAGYAGDSTATARRRAGSLTVLFAWVGLCAAGGSFAKSAEHYRNALGPRAGVAPTIAYDAVVVAAVLGALVIAAGALVALPDFVRAWRAGRIQGVARPLVLALAVGMLAVAATAPLSLWAHHLYFAQRNGADAAYGAEVVAWALTGITSLALGARAAARAVTGSISERALRIESRLAVAAAACGLVVAAASAWWWALMAQRAPWFLAGGLPGAPLSGLSGRMIATVGLMALSVAASGYGLARIARSR